LNWDDLGLGVKGYPNVEIAGFPRNKFKFSVSVSVPPDRHFKCAETDSGRATSLWGSVSLGKLRMESGVSEAVRPWVIRSMVERETAQIV
jgi:hypothetical protein